MRQGMWEQALTNERIKKAEKMYAEMERYDTSDEYTRGAMDAIAWLTLESDCRPEVLLKDEGE